MITRNFDMEKLPRYLYINSTEAWQSQILCGW